MANHLAQDNNPYAYVIRALRNTLKACLEIQVDMTSHMLNQFYGLYLHLCVAIFIVGHIAQVINTINSHGPLNRVNF